MNRSIRKALTILALTATLGTSSSNVFAETRFQQTHPRRARVISRLYTQNRRIDNELKDSQISRHQAATPPGFVGRQGFRAKDLHFPFVLRICRTADQIRVSGHLNRSAREPFQS